MMRPKSKTGTKSGFDIVRKLGSRMPDVEEGTAYGSPALMVRGKMFACIAINKAAEPNTLAVRIDFEQREALIAEEPKIYYLVDHYVSHPCVLARLRLIKEDALRDLLLMGRQFVLNTKSSRLRSR